MEACVFCEIGAGRIDQEVLYEDDEMMATTTSTSSRYEDDTVLPGCVRGEPPWEPPAGGEPERRRVAEVLQRGLAD